MKESLYTQDIRLFSVVIVITGKNTLERYHIVMSHDVAIILCVFVVSWVTFLFNFVLGYYMGRAVESAERKTQNKKSHTKYFSKITFPLVSSQPFSPNKSN